MFKHKIKLHELYTEKDNSVESVIYVDEITNKLVFFTYIEKNGIKCNDKDCILQELFKSKYKPI